LRHEEIVMYICKKVNDIPERSTSPNITFER